MKLEYELKWNSFTEITDDGERVIDMPPNKVLLQSSDEGVTGGYFDSEEQWHEFGGGETPSVQPTLTITVVNNIDSDWDVTPNDDVFLKYENNHLAYYGGSQENVAYGESREFTTILIYYDAIEGFGAFDIGYSLQVGDGVTFTVTNLTNCTFEHDGEDDFILVTDPTKEASCTLTYTLSEEEGDE